jgi:hypothetical protein
MTQPLQQLSSDEEVTLRRVAYGESEVRAMRAQDLARLRRLKLIEEGRDGLQLTTEGRRHFDALPRPGAQSGGAESQDLANALTRMIGKARRE